MKKQISTHYLRQGILALILVATGLIYSGQALASCKAGFTDSVSGKTVIFYNTSTTSTTHVRLTWNYGDGSSNYVTSGNTYHTYPDYNKTYTACLYIYDSSAKCADTICTKITTGAAPCTAYVFYSASGFGVSFSDSGSTALVSGHKHSTTWDFGDGTKGSGDNPSHKYSKAGTFTACVTIYDSVTKCTAKTCQSTVVSGCSISVSYTYSVGTTRNVTFTSTTTGISAHCKYTWYFGDVTKDSSGSKVKHTYSGTTNTYSTALVVYDSATGCTNYATQNIVLCKVSSSFTYSSSGLTLAFKSDSTNNPKTMKFTWDYGDKSTPGSTQNPSHTYSTSGTYTVCLTVQDGTTGCSLQTCQTISVTSCSTSASITYTQAGPKISFTGKSNVTTKKVKYTWIFGDGSSDSTSGLSVVHNYSSKYTSVNAYLKVYDSTTKCLVYATTKIVFCYASASFGTSVSGSTVKFNAVDTGAHLKYKWNFGDSTTSDSKTPTHTFKYGGTHTVCLYETDSVLGCTASLCQSVKITVCSLTASYSYTISGKKVTFSGSGSSTAHVRYQWIFGDGSSDSTTGKSISHTYGSTVKSINAYLVLFDSTTKCVAYVSHTLSFCSASASFTTSINGGIVKFYPNTTNTSTAKYKWTFGDKGTSTDPSPSHTYSATGKYYVCLTVTDSPCTDTHCDSVTISTTTSKWCIHGQVTAGGATGYPCKVYLITYNAKDTSLKAIDSVTIKDSTGKYEFCGLVNGTYYTKAALLKSHSYYKYFIPTYHTDAVKWAKANSITISGADVTGADIKMVKGSNPGGAGFVGGKIKSGANKAGDPVANVEVVLYDSKQNAVAYTYTDGLGNYGFAGITFGTYNVTVEIEGKPCTDAVVTLSDTQTTLSNVDMDVNRLNITPSVAHTSGIKTSIWNATEANIYPNPVVSKLYVATNLQRSQMARVSIYDITGKVVSDINTNIEAGQQNIEIDAAALHQGMYFMKIVLQSDNKILETRFVKVN